MYLRNIQVQGFRASAQNELTCTFPARFSVLLGANNAGKTTVCDALYLAHPHRFPQLNRPSIATLGDPPRSITVEFEFGGGGPEGPLGQALLAQTQQPPRWTRSLERSLGAVRAAQIEDANHVDETRFIYLPAHRNPVDELARREAQVVIELLRSEQERIRGHRNLGDLRGLAGALLDGLLKHDLIESVEARVSAYLASLTGGVSRQHAFIGRQEIDDAFLARVLEFLLAAIDDRALAQRLEVSGLGYVNLLHIAVTLSAIPGGDSTPDIAVTSDEEPSEESNQPTEAEDVADAIGEAGSEAEALEDSFFPDLFHATVVIEEPEAHLHPQLLHGLMRYLRQATVERPELQLIISTHSGEMASACSPHDIVVLKTDESGQRVCRPLAALPISDDHRDRVFRMTELHMDAVRSSALFASRLVLVEGITDALLIRNFGLAWADDSSRRSFIEALTIVPIGSKIGEWPVTLLATPGFEVANRIAILRDSDDRSGGAPPLPSWLDRYDDAVVRCFLSEPTLEPSVTPGNELLVAEALVRLDLTTPDPMTAEAIDDLFRGAAASRKGEFAFVLADIMRTEMAGGRTPVVPAALGHLFAFLYEDSGIEPIEEVADAPAPPY